MPEGAEVRVAAFPDVRRPRGRAESTSRKGNTPWPLGVAGGAQSPWAWASSLALSPVTVAPARCPVRPVLGGIGRLAAQFTVAESDSV